MKHPFETLTAYANRALFLVSLILTLILMRVMNTLGAVLINATAPSGVISFELAGDLATIERMLASWDVSALQRLAFSLGLDFFYLLMYATSISLACLWAGRVWRRAGWKGLNFGVWAAWGLWLAAALDAVENIALTRLLFGERLDWLPLVARWVATFKFGLILLGLLVVVLGLLVFLISPRSRATE